MGLDLSASARLMQMGSKIDQIARQNRGRINEAIEAPSVSPTQQVNQQPMMQGGLTNNKSRLPKEILESFSKRPSMDGQYDSVLDQLGVTPTQTANIRKQIVQENVAQVQPTVIREQAVSSAIDYSLIKSIIDESVKKYVGAYTKKILTEQKNVATSNSNLGVMQIGENFKFVTKDGDLYEATLVYKGNVNKKK